MIFRIGFFLERTTFSKILCCQCNRKEVLVRFVHQTVFILSRLSLYKVYIVWEGLVSMLLHLYIMYQIAFVIGIKI